MHKIVLRNLCSIPVLQYCAIRCIIKPTKQNSTGQQKRRYAGEWLRQSDPGAKARQATIKEGNRKMKIDRLIDKLIELFDAETDYRYSSAKYHKEHPFKTVWMDNPANKEEKHIVYAYHVEDRMGEALSSLYYVLDLNRDQVERLYSAARAMRRWYKLTKWDRIPSEDLNNRLHDFVIG